MHRALGPSSIAAGLLLAACGNTASSTPGASTSAEPAKPPASAAASVEAPQPPAPVSASAASASPASAPASASAPAVASASASPRSTAAPVASASALPSKPAADAGAPVHASVGDAGAGDAGALQNPALQLAQRVDAIFAGAKRYSARFTQKYTQKVMGTVKESTGTVAIERPSKISFRYDPPVRNRIVSDGTTIKVYIADDNQMFESPVQKTQYPGALAFMMGNGISNSFTFALGNPTTVGVTVLEGKPLVPNPSYESVVFFLQSGALSNADPKAISGVLVRDAQGNKNRFDFQDAAMPASFPADEFVFTPPPGTTVTH